MGQKNDNFLDPTDFLLDVSSELLIFAVSGGISLWLRACFHLRMLATLLLIYVLQMIVAMVLIRIILKIFPVKEGVYRYQDRQRSCYVWSLCSFLYMVNLGILYSTRVVPIPMRQLLYTLLGAKIAKAYVSVSGRLADPYLITIEEEAIIGEDALVLPHIMNVSPEKTLVLGKIEFKKRAMVGARAVIMPGVTVGENALVAAMAFVPKDTKIPPYEIWAGIPAKKIGDLPRPPQ